MDLEEENIHSKIQQLISESRIKYYSLFSVKTKKAFIKKLKSLDKENNYVCAKMMKGAGGWICVDCRKDENTIFCHKCWSKMKKDHITHNINFLRSCKGTCDCGDPDAIDEKYFCSDHKGPLKDKKNINLYIENCLDINLIDSFKEISQKLIENLAPYIQENYENNKNEIFNINVIDFLDLISVICNNNKALTHLTSELLLKNYKSKTKHQCICIQDDDTYKIIKTNEEVEHDCFCPFIKLLINVWKDSYKEILYKFLINFRIKKAIGIIYFYEFGNCTKNLINVFNELSVQYIFDEICTTATLTEGLMEKYFYEAYEIIKFFSSGKSEYIKNCPLYEKFIGVSNTIIRFHFLKKFSDELYNDYILLIKSESAKYIGKNEYIYKILIDMLCCIHNSNSMESFYPHKGALEDKFSEKIIEIEDIYTDIFSLFITILDFNNQNMVKNLFKYFSIKFLDKTNNKLKEKEYSFNITLIRGFEIFLNRYCFHYVHQNKNSNLKDAYNSAKKMMFNYEEIINIILNSLFKEIGFINACRENFLNYYGEDMQCYGNAYFLEHIFYCRDFSIIKYILSDENFKSLFSLKNIYKCCSLENTYNILEKYFISENNSNLPIDFLKIDDGDNIKYMNFNAKILNYFIGLIRCNFCLLFDLGVSFKQLMYDNINDQIITDIVLNDKETVTELLKQIIVNNIICNQNLSEFTKINEKIFFSLKKILGEEAIENLIISMTNKTLTLNKTAKFSVKDENLKYFDSNYIYFSPDKSSAEKYLSDFKKEKLSIYNSYFYPFLKVESELEKSNFENFFINQDNFDFIYKLTKLLFTNSQYKIMHSFLLNVILSYWNSFIHLGNSTSPNFNDFLIENKQKLIQLCDMLINNDIKNDIQKAFSKIISESIMDNNNFIKIKIITQNDINSENKQNINNNLRSNKYSLKDKLKNKFKQKNEELKNVYNTENIILDSKIQDPCVYCLKLIEKNKPAEPVGFLAQINWNNIVFNAFKQTIKNEYIKYTKYNENKFDDFIKILENNFNKNLSIFSCNHYVHYVCFNKLIISCIEQNKNPLCPFCHRLFNIIIPIFNSYKNEEVLNLLEGYNILNAYKIGKEVSPYYKQNEIESNGHPLIKLKNKYREILQNKIVNTNEKKQEDDILKIIDEESKKIEEFSKLVNENEKISKIYDFTIIFHNGINLEIEKNIFQKEIDYDNSRILATKKLIECYSKIFEDVIDFSENIENFKTQINYYENIILMVRILIKTNYYQFDYIFYFFYKIIQQLNSFEFNDDLLDLVMNGKIKIMLSQLIFVISVLFDFESFKGFEKFIILKFLPILGIELYVKKIFIENEFQCDKKVLELMINKDKIIKFLNNIDKKELNDILKFITKRILFINLLSRKIKSENNDKISEINFDLNFTLENINLTQLKNLSFSEILTSLNSIKDKNSNISNIFCNNIKNEEIISTLIKSININKLNNTINITPYLLRACLPIKYNFIDLPISAIGLQYQFYEIPCANCGACGLVSFICLTCGKKFCNSDNCKYNGKKSWKYHTKICGGNRSIFLQTSNYKVLIVNYENVDKKDNIPLYVNKFGEGIVDRYTSKEYKLDKEEITKAYNMFINYCQK